MRITFISVIAALAAQKVAGHATFQQLWINGVDQIYLYQSTCVRLPSNNNPITDVTGTTIRCNGRGGVTGKCPVVAGQTLTVEMHQQNGDRSCTNEAIGGAHYGPVQVYLSKVTDASTADGSTGWFKIFQDTWSPKAGAASGDDDNWGTKDLNTCCGRMNVKIPSDIPAGDYLLRAEVIALHVAGSSGGAQFYVSCYQLTVTGGGSASPSVVSLPGAYKASDPGILVNIHATLATYVAPGPTVYGGGTTKSAGAVCAGVETGKTTGPAVTQTNTGGASSPTGCTVAKYAQCGGNTYTGCTNCEAGSTCVAVSPPYYSQCT
ncbi:glycoside hydrolase family 61 protein [Bisporella sp. PMI_857]|nr:glycoside hydrolase family 61 protein [Bisporella sp. PMI_857]